MRLLAAMGYTPWGRRSQDPYRLSPTELADTLDVTPETVRSRIEGLEEAGVIQGWETYPSPRHLDATVSTWAFCPPRADLVDENLDELLLLDGVLEVLTYRGPLVAVALANRGTDQQQRRLTLVGRRLEDEAPVHVYDPPMPEVDHEMDRLDWRIVAALRGQARRPLRDVADEVDSSYRTVKRRFDRMTDEGSLFVVPRVSLARVQGLLPFTLVIRVDDADAREVYNEAVKRFDERVLHAFEPNSPDARFLVFGLYADTVAHMEELTSRAREVSCVAEAFSVLSRSRHATSWIDERVRAAIDASE
jgi:DNA-binding Lrp family transcriptional regulator